MRTKTKIILSILSGFAAFLAFSTDILSWFVFTTDKTDKDKIVNIGLKVDTLVNSHSSLKNNSDKILNHSKAIEHKLDTLLQKQHRISDTSPHLTLASFPEVDKLRRELGIEKPSFKRSEDDDNDNITLVNFSTSSLDLSVKPEQRKIEVFNINREAISASVKNISHTVRTSIQPPPDGHGQIIFRSICDICRGFIDVSMADIKRPAHRAAYSSFNEKYDPKNKLSTSRVFNLQEGTYTLNVNNQNDLQFNDTIIIKRDEIIIYYIDFKNPYPKGQGRITFFSDNPSPWRVEVYKYLDDKKVAEKITQRNLDNEQLTFFDLPANRYYYKASYLGKSDLVEDAVRGELYIQEGHYQAIQFK